MNAKREFFSMAERRRFVGSMAAKRAEDLLAMLERVTAFLNDPNGDEFGATALDSDIRALLSQIKGE